jgi:hypothetical protein
MALTCLDFVLRFEHNLDTYEYLRICDNQDIFTKIQYLVDLNEDTYK